MNEQGTMTETITKEQLHILRHSLGLDDTGRGREYRNHYAIATSCSGWPEVQALIEKGLMKDTGVVPMWGELHGVVVTEAGKEAARQLDSMPMLTLGQRRWRAWLHADNGLTFGEWLKTDWAKVVR